MGALLIWLSGASPKILKRCPTERPKYLGIGSVILMTAAIASLSMAFALRQAVMVPTILAVVLALAWGIVIIALNRWLIVSLDRQERAWRYLILAIPNLALSVLLGIVISTPLVLQIFRSDIDRQIALIHVQSQNAYFREMRTSPLSQQIASSQAKVSYLERVVATGGLLANPLTSPELINLMAQRAQAQNQADAAYKQWSCEIHGSPGSCVTGSGPLAEVDLKQYQNDVAVVRQYDRQINKLRSHLLAEAKTNASRVVEEARADLPDAKGGLVAEQQEQQDQTASFVRANASDTGLLIRLEALGAFSQSSALNAARWLLFTLFTVIQCLPITVKVLLNLGPENTYEKMVDLEEAMILRAAREDSLRRQAARALD